MAILQVKHVSCELLLLAEVRHLGAHVAKLRVTVRYWYSIRQLPRLSVPRYLSTYLH